LRFNGGSPPTRSLAAIRQYVKRHQCITAAVCSDEESERSALSVAQVATDLGLSRASVYRLLKRGALRRFKGGVAETSFSDLLREHPEAIPYSTLPRDKREWLVLNGYSDPSLSVKRPSVRGFLDLSQPRRCANCGTNPNCCATLSTVSPRCSIWLV